MTKQQPMIFASRALAILYSFLKFNCNKKDYFILPINICHSVYWCFIKAGIPVIFCDIEPTHLCLDLDRTTKILQHFPCQGLLFNHTYGTSYYPQDKLHKIKNITDKFFIIDDRCLCPPNIDFFSGYHNNSVADLTIFSTGYAKYVDIGYGGFGFVSNDVVLPEIVYLPYDKNDEAWLEKRKNDKLPISNDDIQKKQWLNSSGDINKKAYMQKIIVFFPEINNHKQQLNKIYCEQLDQRITKLQDEFNGWRYNLWTPKQSELLKSIFASELFASAHYEINSEMKQDFPVASHLSSGVINLFNDKYFTVEQAQKCVSVINRFIFEN